MTDDVAYTVSLTSVSADVTLRQINAGELLERQFDTADALWSFVPPFVLSTLLIALVPDASSDQPDPTTNVTTVWEGVADVGTAWIFDSDQIDGLSPGHFVRLERSRRDGHQAAA